MLASAVQHHRYGHGHVCEILLLDGCNVNAKYNYGMTALHHAAELGFDQIVTILLAHKADTSARQQEDKTAMDLAVEKEHKRVGLFVCLFVCLCVCLCVWYQRVCW